MRKAKKIGAWLVAWVLVFSLLVPAWASSSDSDVVKDSAQEEVTISVDQELTQDQEREREREREREKVKEKKRKYEEESVTGEVYKGVRNALQHVKNPVARAALQAILEGRSVSEAVYEAKALLEEWKAERKAEAAEVVEGLADALQADTSLDELSKAKLTKEVCKLLREIGKAERAREMLEEILDKLAGDDEAYQELDKAYAATGDLSVKVFLHGKPLRFDVPPRIQNGRVLVPIRALAENLGAEVSYDNGTVIIKNRGVTIILRIGSREAQVGGRVITLDVPAQVVDGRTLVPLRFVGENLNAKVQYYGESHLVAVTD